MKLTQNGDKLLLLRLFPNKYSSSREGEEDSRGLRIQFWVTDCASVVCLWKNFPAQSHLQYLRSQCMDSRVEMACLLSGRSRAPCQCSQALWSPRGPLHPSMCSSFCFWWSMGGGSSGQGDPEALSLHWFCTCSPDGTYRVLWKLRNAARLRTKR